MKYGKLYTSDLFFYMSHVRLHKNKTHAFEERGKCLQRKSTRAINKLWEMQKGVH